MNYAYTTAITNCKPLTLDDIKAVWKKVEAIEAKYPKRDRCVALEMPPTTEDALSLAATGSVFPAKIDITQPSPLFGSVYGLPIRTRLDVPAYCYIERMADGSGVMHYRNGLAVRCLEPT